METRLYLTGDLARWRNDGQLELLGRRDGQVKLRGLRLELGEIEAQLRTHAAVAAAAVRLRTAADGTATLLAYVVPRAGVAAAEADAAAWRDELRAYLAARLPAAQVPARYLALAELPLTAHGKLDERALPAEAEAATSERVAGYVAPRAGRERRLATVWCEVFGLAEVGRMANFFDLGGHSLLLLALQQGIARELGQAVSLLELFEYPTIASLAAHLAARAETATEAEAAEDDERAGQRAAGVARRQQRLGQRRQRATPQEDHDG